MYEIKNLTIYRSDEQEPVLRDLYLTSSNNSSIAIIGNNGSGKTTFAFSLIGLIPFCYKGIVNGEFYSDNINIFNLSFQDRISRISYVFQDAESQILFGKVEDVLGLNEGDKNHTIILDLITILDVKKMLNKEPRELSSGEAQKIALISAMRNNPNLVIYDEATTALDYKTRKKFKCVVEYLLKCGKNILLLGQNSKMLNEYAHKVFYISDRTLSEKPIVSKLPEYCFFDLIDLPIINSQFNSINIEYIGHSYKNWSYKLEVNNLVINNGETIAIVGENGSGKSTFLNCINGYINPRKFRTNISNKKLQYYIFTVFSSPSIQFCEPTIKNEICRINSQMAKRIEIIQKIFPFLDLNKDPLDLSFGEQRVLTFLQAILSNKSILLFDEPELGMDESNYNFIKYILNKNIQDKKRTIMYVTHDFQLAENFSTRVLQFENGKIIRDEPNNGLSIESWFMI